MAAGGSADDTFDVAPTNDELSCSSDAYIHFTAERTVAHNKLFLGVRRQGQGEARTCPIGKDMSISSLPYRQYLFSDDCLKDKRKSPVTAALCTTIIVYTLSQKPRLIRINELLIRINELP